MASQNRGSISNLKLDLLKEGHAFSFYQVIRLLRLFRGQSEHEGEPYTDDLEHIQIRPKLSLAFPAADVTNIEEFQEDDISSFRITVAHLGLYGPSSPLPSFYTEDLMEEKALEESVSRDFLDIINHRLFSLLFQCWSKYRQFIQVVEKQNDDYLVRLFSLLGIGEEALREDIDNSNSLIRYIGLLTQFPRSAQGLERLLQDAFDDVEVSVHPCVHRMAKIPEDQRLLMGGTVGTLGVDSFIGEEIADRMGKFRLEIGPMDKEHFRMLLPGSKGCERLKFLTKFYVTDELEYEAELILAEGEAKNIHLGQPDWSMLGCDTWLFSGSNLGEVSATIYP